MALRLRLLTVGSGFDSHYAYLPASLFSPWIHSTDMYTIGIFMFSYTNKRLSVPTQIFTQNVIVDRRLFAIYTHINLSPTLSFAMSRRLLEYLRAYINSKRVLNPFVSDDGGNVHWQHVLQHLAIETLR